MSANTCRCGCGEMVKATYRPGHDARHVSQLVKAYGAGNTVERRKVRKQVGSLSEALQAKFERGLAKATPPSK